MRQNISNLQLILLVANFIFSASIISLPQIVVHVGGQNSWLVPICTFPILLLFIFLIFGKSMNIPLLKNLFLIGNKSKLSEKGFILLFMLFITITFLRDLRSLVDFVAAILLPNTPINMIMVLSIFVILYIAMSGLEVISRINAIHFGILLSIIFLLPLLLLNETQWGNLQPLPTFHDFTALMKSVYFTMSWMGESLFFILVIGSTTPVKQSRRAVITGTIIGLFVFFILIFMLIAVLGTEIVKEATYPSLILIQQIHLTDFLDRLDLIIVAVWVPAMIAKIAYLLYAFNYCLSYLYKSNTNKFLLPISFILGFLAILLFKNNMDHLHFSFYTWGSLGLIIEVMVVLAFLIVKRNLKKT